MSIERGSREPKKVMNEGSSEYRPGQGQTGKEALNPREPIQKKESLRQAEDRELTALFNGISLAEKLPTTFEDNRSLRVGLIGAGAAFEAWPLHDYLKGKGKEPKMTAYDMDDMSRDTALTWKRTHPIDLEYKLGDLTNADTLGAPHDLLFSRRPDAFPDPSGKDRQGNWGQIYNKAIENLSPGGVLFVTADLPSVRDYLEETLAKHKNLSVETTTVPDTVPRSENLSDHYLFLAKKLG